MKIIDLLNAIANGKDVPKKIKYRDKIWKYNSKFQDYMNENDVYLFVNIFEIEIERALNHEVEIIEEDKKIEYEQIEELTCNEYDFEKKTINLLIKNQMKLIDEINKLKEND